LPTTFSNIKQIKELLTEKKANFVKDNKREILADGTWRTDTTFAESNGVKIDSAVALRQGCGHAPSDCATPSHLVSRASFVLCTFSQQLFPDWDRSQRTIALRESLKFMPRHFLYPLPFV